jgi:hypothetical protein
MKTFKKIAFSIAAAALCASSAHALTFTFPAGSPAGPFGGDGNPSLAEVQAAAQTAFGISAANIGSLLYKAEGGSLTSESGNAGYFSISKVNSAPPEGEQTATITYTGPSALDLDLSVILVKDGQAGWTLWDARTWTSAFDTIVVDNSLLWNNPNALGGISNIQIFGKTGTSVPDGGATAALLGIGVLGLAAVRRKK